MGEGALKAFYQGILIKTGQRMTENFLKCLLFYFANKEMCTYHVILNFPSLDFLLGKMKKSGNFKFDY